MMGNKTQKGETQIWLRKQKQRGADSLLSRRPLKNLKASNFKKGASYAYRKSFYHSAIELERGVVHQLPHDIRQQR
jgi:hypothetical protein